MRVEVIGLRKQFSSTLAVDDLSFSFSSGEILGFIGPNGAGKTTTLRILATVDEPTAGTVQLDGVSVVEEPEKARRLVGYVPDSLPTHRDMTVDDYLDFFARAHGIRGDARRRVLDSVREFTSLAPVRGKLLDALSKGMKQRVSLARALLHDPPVLVLDEPASGLDPRARVELRELLKILRERGKAVLISSHILADLAEICDGALIIERGRLVTTGTIEELSSRGSPHATVFVRPLGRVEELHRALLELPGVRVARLVDDGAAADLDGGEEAACDVLAQLVARGFRIVEFRLQRAGLEEVFMNVTRGELQ